MAPRTYNINCIGMSGNAFLSVVPATAQVVINVTGNSCTANSPVDLSGGSVLNTSGQAANLLVNYAGNQQVKLSGGASTYMAVNAPNAAVKIERQLGLSKPLSLTRSTTVAAYRSISTKPSLCRRAPQITYASVTSSYNTAACDSAAEKFSDFPRGQSGRPGG